MICPIAEGISGSQSYLVVEALETALESCSFLRIQLLMFMTPEHIDHLHHGFAAFILQLLRLPRAGIASISLLTRAVM